MSGTIITRCDDLPEPKELAEAYELELQSQNGQPIRFGELVAGKGVHITTVVIFIRHFFCAYDQGYVRVVSRRLTDSLIIIGCGDSQRIVPYVSETEAAFPIYTDRTGKIYEKLHMKRTRSHATKPPSYVQISFFGALGKTFKQMLRSGRQAGKCVYVHRMEHVSDHLTADQLLEVLSHDEPAETK
ncbi:uncharacterized protein P174DRAFT_459468 [Aspergillus novofumigatus IBT 16806]|uniref:Uncharacterized protein n=1 Tax=Aspergillus novofumigatus (strain IBT 16806) TaxID=1392255 RepID=A0A2I1CEE1_ASPN1|nr:uncharacterized protein P174DRAFT_459468 [Aspergillus novofumigatus IBT 16806]PKX95986.1 hypothetical protein P174DRAFT_459468 [Aspergillus novofumigatus IBT 16806]